MAILLEMLPVHGELTTCTPGIVFQELWVVSNPGCACSLVHLAAQGIAGHVESGDTPHKEVVHQHQGAIHPLHSTPQPQSH